MYSFAAGISAGHCVHVAVQNAAVVCVELGATVKHAIFQQNARGVVVGIGRNSKASRHGKVVAVAVDKVAVTEQGISVDARSVGHLNKHRASVASVQGNIAIGKDVARRLSVKQDAGHSGRSRNGINADSAIYKRILRAAIQLQACSAVNRLGSMAATGEMDILEVVAPAGHADRARASGTRVFP